MASAKISTVLIVPPTVKLPVIFVEPYTASLYALGNVPEPITMFPVCIAGVAFCPVPMSGSPASSQYFCEPPFIEIVAVLPTNETLKSEVFKSSTLTGAEISPDCTMTEPVDELDEPIGVQLPTLNEPAGPLSTFATHQDKPFPPVPVPAS